MARIRTIKPEFPQSESIGRLSRDARLLFILLWTIVDDAGRTRAAPRMLASLLFPYDDDAAQMIGGWLQELEQVGCVRRYASEGGAYLDIPQWLKHQKVDKPSASRLPAFAEPSPTTLGTSTPSVPNSSNPRGASRDVADTSRDFSEPPRSLAPDLGPRTVGRDQEKDSSLRSLAMTGKRKAGDGPEAIRAELARVLDAEHVEAVYGYRLARKAAQTSYGARLLADELAKTGSPNEAADLMIRQNWQGFKAAWWERDRADNSHDARAGPSRSRPAIRTNTYFQAALESQADENRNRLDRNDDFEERALDQAECRFP